MSSNVIERIRPHMTTSFAKLIFKLNSVQKALDKTVYACFLFNKLLQISYCNETILTKLRFVRFNISLKKEMLQVLSNRWRA